MIGHDYRYAVEQILLTMFPAERPVYPDTASGGGGAVIALRRGARFAVAACRLTLGGGTFLGSARVETAALADPLVEDRLLQRIVKLSFYRAALRAGVPKPGWGALTGIRPAKLLRKLLEEGLSERTALSRFIRRYDVSRERAELCLGTARESLLARRSLEERDICLYIGIPFCPTRCAYCSFVSLDVSRSMELIPAFLEALWLEMEATASVVRELGLRVVSVYVGGGTPTTLDEGQLDALCGRLETMFDLTAVREFTVEAGRPDTITLGKLKALRRHGVTRVSVNPQSMSDRVLEAIGRKHSVGQVREALSCARAAGDFDINMDLIAGLPADSAEGFRETLRAVLALSPENVTVHTLAMKKGSRLLLEGTAIPSAAEVGRMLDAARDNLTSAGYKPYYLYRQKFMSGGFENVGWSKAEKASLYNLCVMEELTTVLAMGGGASTKLVAAAGRIERIFAPKYPREYINGIGKVVGDKRKLTAFYRESAP